MVASLVRCPSLGGASLLSSHRSRIARLSLFASVNLNLSGLPAAKFTKNSNKYRVIPGEISNIVPLSSHSLEERWKELFHQTGYSNGNDNLAERGESCASPFFTAPNAVFPAGKQPSGRAQVLSLARSARTADWGKRYLKKTEAATLSRSACHAAAECGVSLEEARSLLAASGEVTRSQALKRSQEIFLATLAQDGERAKILNLTEELCSRHGAEAETQADIEMRIWEGKRARQYLINCNTGMLFVIATGFTRNPCSLLKDELMLEGLDCLHRCISKFNIQKGLRFSTYAWHGVRWSMERAIENEGRVIRIPVNRHAEYRRLLGVKEDLFSENGRPATLLEIKERTSFQETKIRELHRIFKVPISLDVGVRMGDSSVGVAEMRWAAAIEHALVDESMESATEYSVRKDFEVAVEMEAKSVLTDIEFEVVGARYGVWGPTKGAGFITMDEAGRLFGGISRKSVHLILKAALSKLRMQSSFWKL